MTTRTTSQLAAVVLVAFTAFSLWVVAEDGLLGFLWLAGREPWALQMLLDLVIAFALVTRWLVPDARARQITAWPYLVLIAGTGSIGGLAYLVRRGLGAAGRTSNPATSHGPSVHAGA
ncbi:MAG: hypothetical protein KBG28_15005 [Kofleriaceae bacterium]|nr:hypothetical protein [Kofleriaceae bacterium]